MSDLKRIRKVLNWLIYSDYATNDNELAEKLGYTKSSFSQIINGKVPLSDKFIDRLCSIDENINKVWIKTGNGEILLKYDHTKNEKINEPIVPYGNARCINCDALKKEIDWLKKEIELKNEIIRNKEELLDMYKPLFKKENSKSECELKDK